MTETKTNKNYTCKNCGHEFIGNYCPECGQSVKEFERPFQFMIIDFMGNMFAFDTRFWKTFIAVLFKPGSLALDYVKGHRVRYMPPFRFYVFISFIFFLLLNIFATQKTKLGSENRSDFVVFGEYDDDEPEVVVDSLNLVDEVQEDLLETDDIQAKKDFLNEHPELFFEQLLKNFSWTMFLLMPFYGFLLWLFYRKSQQYYITHFIMAINQHAFMFFVLSIVLGLALVLPDFSEVIRILLILIIPIHFIIGYRILYKQKIVKSILKLFAISLIYSTIVLATSVGLVLLVVLQNGIKV